jgi:hypothetical protein
VAEHVDRDGVDDGLPPALSCRDQPVPRTAGDDVGDVLGLISVVEDEEPPLVRLSSP